MSERSVTMHLEPDSARRDDEERRYFPDWTEPLAEVREEVEADHNSYLAGGYAEEFGYRARPGSSRGVWVLDGAPPEESAEWHLQSGAVHPGYPIRPRPIVFDGEVDVERQRIAASQNVSLEIAHGHGTFVRVTDRPYEHERHRVEQRAAAVLTRFVAALVTFRWGLPHRRHASAMRKSQP
jgi:hypothetical protein